MEALAAQFMAVPFPTRSIQSMLNHLPMNWSQKATSASILSNPIAGFLLGHIMSKSEHLGIYWRHNLPDSRFVGIPYNTYYRLRFGYVWLSCRQLAFIYSKKRHRTASFLAMRRYPFPQLLGAAVQSVAEVLISPSSCGSHPNFYVGYCHGIPWRYCQNYQSITPAAAPSVSRRVCCLHVLPHRQVAKACDAMLLTAIPSGNQTWLGSAIYGYRTGMRMGI